MTSSSTPLDPRTPVIVGVGQIVQRVDNPSDALEPAGIMAEALLAAASDAGADGLVGALDSIRVIKGAWPYNDPGRVIADRIGADPAETGVSPDGGNSPQSLLNRTAISIQNGELSAVALVGGEAIYSRRRARRKEARIPYTDDSQNAPAPSMGDDVMMSSDYERAMGFEMPINIYPVFESAIRHDRGETLDAHRDRVSQLWEGFNKVAVANPYAWRREAMTAEEIRNPSATNRMVGFPYTKAMNSNWDLDQAAAVVLCSVETAERLGVSRDKWVFPHSGTDAHDTYLFSERGDLHSSPAIRVAGRVALELAGVGVDDLAHVDLYSCFPSAVQIAAAELGLSEQRQLTQTGGLTFAGGPLNNYVMHGIASLVDTLRANAGSVGLQSANGGYVTKHAIGVYSTEPPSNGFRHLDVQDEVDTHPSTTTAADHVGAATIEAYTVMHNADGPEKALVVGQTSDGHRVLANSTDDATLDAMLSQEHIGRSIEIREGGVAELV